MESYISLSYNIDNKIDLDYINNNINNIEYFLNNNYNVNQSVNNINSHNSSFIKYKVYIKKKNSINYECPICYNNINPINYIKLNCDHYLCKDCHEKWNDKCNENKIKMLCPLCRKS
jgi:hypothetical protein